MVAPPLPGQRHTRPALRRPSARHYALPDRRFPVNGLRLV